MLRLLYVDPVVLADGRPASPTVAPHVLKSAAVSVASHELGRASGEPQPLLWTSRDGAPVQFHGFEGVQFAPGTSVSSPMMVGVVQDMRDGAVEHVLIDHTSDGAPIVKYIGGLPRSPAPTAVHRAFLRSCPGIGYALDDRVPVLRRHRLLLSMVTADETNPDIAQLVVDFLMITPTSATFRETDRIPVVGSSEGVYSSTPIAWHPGLRRWIVMITVGAWHSRFQLVDLDGRFFRTTSGVVPISEWWPEQQESGHVGNEVFVHPITGNVIFHTGHTRRAIVFRRQGRGRRFHLPTHPKY